MNTDKVLALARKAGGVKLSLEFETWKITEPGLLRFAALIQREMEAENAELRNRQREEQMSFISELERLKEKAIADEWGMHSPLSVYLLKHADEIAELVKAAESALNHAEFLDEANKEDDALARAATLGGMVISIIENLKPALANLNKEKS